MLSLAGAAALAAGAGFGGGGTDAAATQGIARIVDGDTLAIADRKVRLFGIDAPEMDQRCLDASGAAYRCGLRSREALERIAQGRTVRCEGQGEDPYGRLVAACFADGEDIGRSLVRGGWALAFRKFSGDYVAVEDAARRDRVGMWAGKFTAPWDHRAGVYGAQTATADADPALAAKLAPRGAAAPDAACAIKGNVSASGRIYHRPGDRSYGDTRISPAKGERWFCSETEARDAGWRPARN